MREELLDPPVFQFVKPLIDHNRDYSDFLNRESICTLKQEEKEEDHERLQRV